MLIIFGTRLRAKAIAVGEFFCPSCGVDRNYVLQQVRRWFTLFFLPVVPTGKVLGEQVRCSTCGTCFRPEVLHAPTSAVFTETLRGAMRVAAIAMLSAGDRANPAARHAAIDAARKSGAENYDDSWLDHDLVALDPSTLGAYLEPLAKGLSAQGKEGFVEKIARIGLADGALNGGESQVLEVLGAGLDISAAHLRGITVTVADGPHPEIGDTPPDSRLN
jgi:hypothetical protein